MKKPASTLSTLTGSFISWTLYNTVLQKIVETKIVMNRHVFNSFKLRILYEVHIDVVWLRFLRPLVQGLQVTVIDS
jgi:hypothetical protein